MKKAFLIFALVSLHISFAQNTPQNITISYQNATRIEVINQIEQQTDFRFYFVEEWLNNELVSGSFTNSSLGVILEDLFDDTLINFYIGTDKKVILTRNNLIYDSLPEQLYSEKKPVQSESDVTNPVFYNEADEVKLAVTETVRIGKETKSSRKQAYNLQGVIKNVITGEPIANLALIVLNKNINAVTDINGNYALQLPPGVSFLEAKALGYESVRKKIIIYNDGILNFEINENTEMLEEVLVEASQQRHVKSAITGITQFQPEEIKSIPLVLGERDVLKVAMTMPGIKKTGEGSAGFSVRGGKEDQNLILLDNAVIYNPSHFFGIFSALNPFTTGEVNIYKGSIPAEYGGRLSSVFEINTKSASTDEFAGEGSIGPVTGNLNLEIPIEKGVSSLIVGARGTYSDWVLKSLDDESLKNSKASFYDGVFKYKHELDDKNDFEASGYYSNDSFSITSDSLYTYNNRLFSLKWDRRINDKHSGSLILSNSDYNFNIDFDGSRNDDFKLGYQINETELKLKMKLLQSDTHKFDYGIATKLYKVNPGIIEPLNAESIVNKEVIPKEKGLESALFITDNYSPNKKLLLSAGLRFSTYTALGPASQRVYVDGLPKSEGTAIDTLSFDNNEKIKTYSGPELRASFRYFLHPSLSLKGSYSNSYQYIHSLSNNTTASPTDIWKLSDYNIEPQKANQFTLGLYKNFDESFYEISLEGYYKRSKNILDYKTGANLLLNSSIETEVLQGEGKAYGLEFLIKKTKGRLNGWIGYSYSRSLIKLASEFSEEQINNGEYFPSNYDKPHDLSVIANIKLTKRYSFSANFNYQTGRPITYPVGKYDYNGSEYVMYSDRNKFRIPDYYRVDIGFNVEGNHKIKKFAHSYWNISIYNVLGRNNPYSVFFVTEDNQIKAYQSSIFSIPIPTFTYNFKF